MSDEQDHERWARLRFSVIGQLLAAPPAHGQLKSALLELSQRTWSHPNDGSAVRFAFSTIEAWFHAARKANDPVAALRRQRREDAGQSRRLTPALSQAIDAQYRRYSSWTMQLHYDNLVALAAEQPELAPVPSYATMRRYFKTHGYHRKRKPRSLCPGALAAVTRLETREVRSYEVAHVHGLWHTDFHHGSRRVLLADGRWITPLLFGVIDDHSRLICHLQWYTDETAESFVHGLSQALQKRALPRALMCDNGAAMKSEEFRGGLHALGIVLDNTLPYSPYMNGKKETFWSSVEGRLMAMLEQVPELTLAQLNQITQVWVEQDYHQARHREIGITPMERYRAAPNVGRACPDSATLRGAFCRTVTRMARRSDGTVSLDGGRYEIPSRYRHIERPRLRYARWNLAQVELLDPHGPTVLCRLYPIDKQANASGVRRTFSSVDDEQAGLAAQVEPADPSEPWPPLLRAMLAEFAATGLPPAYVPKGESGSEPAPGS